MRVCHDVWILFHVFCSVRFLLMFHVCLFCLCLLLIVLMMSPVPDQPPVCLFLVFHLRRRLSSRRFIWFVLVFVCFVFHLVLIFFFHLLVFWSAFYYLLPFVPPFSLPGVCSWVGFCYNHTTAVCVFNNTSAHSHNSLPPSFLQASSLCISGSMSQTDPAFLPELLRVLSW